MKFDRFFKKCRLFFSPWEWRMRLLGLRPSEKTTAGRSLVLVQIDGLSHPDLQAALKKGHMPFLSWLLNHEGYRLQPVYSGIPSNTPAFQGEFFFGKPQCVPAFQFLDRKTQKVFTMYERSSAEEIEGRLLQEGEGLISDGSACGNIFAGAARESHVCASTADWATALKSWNPYSLFITSLLTPIALSRAVFLCLVEAFLAFVDFIRGSLRGQDALMEVSFIFMRVLGSVLVREIATANAQMDIYRGFPVVQVNYFGYDEQAHRRGPSTRFAYWSLSGIDRAVRKIWKAAARSPRGAYDVWIYSDHGQTQVTPFEKAAGMTIQNAVAELFQEIRSDGKSENPGRVKENRKNWGDTVMGTARSHSPEKIENQESPVVTTVGPIAQVYFPAGFTEESKKTFALSLLKKHPAIPVIAVPLENGEVCFETHQGTRKLPADAEVLLGAGHPYLKNTAEDLLSLMKHENRGDLMIFGWIEGAEAVSFSNENGSHAGLTPRETQAFALLPEHTPLENRTDAVVRARHLRQAALTVLGKTEHGTEIPRPEAVLSGPLPKLRVLSYNVHSCVGMDGVLSVSRIARVIAKANPDIVALQELDAGRRIEGGDQAAAIARELKMHFLFHPVCGENTQSFGNAVLSRYPLKKIETWHLPCLAGQVFCEPRGVLWVEIDFHGRPVQIFNTHLSVWPPELKQQMRALLDDERWRSPSQEDALILCGDFNFSTGSPYYRKLTESWEDVHQKAGKPAYTWLSQYPLRRLDYIWKKGTFSAEPVLLKTSLLERTASDHLPVAADFSFNS